MYVYTCQVIKVGDTWVGEIFQNGRLSVTLRERKSQDICRRDCDKVISKFKKADAEAQVD